jgi:hypothetical protein
VDVCVYTINKYVDVDSIKTEGDDLNPYWGEVPDDNRPVNTLGDRREARREEIYKVVFMRDNGKDVDCKFDRDVWESYREGDTYQMEFNIAGKGLCSSLAQ